MYKDLKTAVHERDKQRILFAEFNASVPTRFSDEWECLVIAYEEDPTGVNPYAETVTGEFFPHIERYLSQAEAHRL